MVVEENPDDFYLISRRIQSAGAKNPLVTFFDGDDAIRHLEKVVAEPERNAVPCLVFTDLKLLGADGFEIVA